MSMIDTLQGVIKGRDFSQLNKHERELVAQELVRSSAFASAALVAVPIPLSELLLTTPVNIAMLVGLGRIYGKTLSKSEAGELLAELLAAAGGSVVASRLWISLSKIILPGLGVYLFIPYVYAVTWAIGRVAMVYFSGGEASGAGFKERFQSFVDEGKRAFSYRAFRDFVRRHGDEVKRSAAEDADSSVQGQKQEPSASDRAGSSRSPRNNSVVDADWDEPDSDEGHFQQSPPQGPERVKTVGTKPAGTKSAGDKVDSKQAQSPKKVDKKSRPKKNEVRQNAAKKTSAKKAAKKSNAKKSALKKAVSKKTKSKKVAPKKSAEKSGKSKKDDA